MVAITVISRAGSPHELNGDEGATLMEVARRALDEIEALCGGCCSCATCHVYIDPAYSDRLPAISQSEGELLDCSDHRKPNSRLSCQIILKPELAGLSATVAPAD